MTDDRLSRLADLVIASANLTGKEQEMTRANALRLALSIRSEQAATVIPFTPRRPNPDQPLGAA